MLPHRFYSAFGELLYAIAISDSKVQTEEIDELHRISRELIQEYLPNQELSNFNALLAESGFYNDFNAHRTKDEALNAFLSFYRENKSLFSPDIKTLCIQAITRVAEAYAGIVTEEKRLILRLEEAFKE